MRQAFNALAFLLLFCFFSFALGACASDGGVATTPVATTGAQTVGGNQGTAQATESGSAVNHLYPTVVNAFAAKTVRVSSDQNGRPVVDVTSADDATVEVSGAASFGYVRWGDAGVQAHVESGGGAAGGAGDAIRTATPPVLQPQPVAPPGN